jgi:ubiquinol-cytochrome c reductase cytochrome b subunit
VILPVLGIIEKPLPQPATIEEAFDADHPIESKSAGTTAATPAE